MKIYNVGVDVPYDLPGEDCQEFVWMVYDYHDDGYEGYGEAVMLGVDGNIYKKNLSHCSCYGPFDGWGTNCDKVTVGEFLRVKDNVLDMEVKDAIELKVRELLSERV